MNFIFKPVNETHLFQNINVTVNNTILINKKNGNLMQEAPTN